ncbi:MAG: hypothetical protein KGH75_06095 [Rhodospirillales bacterium]|nr:hypothetical protein [Rhodospirillales bacterium]
MTESDRKRFAGVLAGLCDYYEKALGDGVVTLYWNSLREYSIEEIEAAAAMHVGNPDRGRFMPKIADFIAAISGSVDEAAAIAWDSVLRNRCGGDEAAVAALASMGGWYPAIGSKNTDEMPFIEKQFALRYKAFRRRDEKAERSLGLADIVMLPVKS